MTHQEAMTLAESLKRRFDAEVEVEQVDSSGRFRFGVVSPLFQTMTQLQRQDEIWKAVDETLSREATLGISLILAFAPEELAETGEPT
jgi:stress-induced morphogen